MNHPNRQRNPRLRPLAPAFRRPLLRSLVNGRPARIGAGAEQALESAARTSGLER